MTERIRVLHLLASAHAGGIQSFVLEVARRYDRSRFEMGVAILDAPGTVSHQLRNLDVEVLHLRYPSLLQPGSVARYFQTVKRRWDVVHANAGGRLPRYLARAAGATRVVTHVHAFPEPWIPGLRRDPRLVRHRLRRSLAAGAHHLLANSRYTLRTILAAAPELGSRTTLLPMGVDLGRFRPLPAEHPELLELRRAHGIASEDALVGFVGRLAPQKGVPALLQAVSGILQMHPRARCVVIGNGPLLPEVERAARQFPPGEILALGERWDVPLWLATFDLLLLPSSWEPFGLVAAEAQAAGCPVVGFALDGIPEVVAHDETGILVPPGDSVALAEAALAVLRQCDLRQRLATAGRRRAETQFNASSMVAVLQQFYESGAGVRE